MQLLTERYNCGLEGSTGEHLGAGGLECQPPLHRAASTFAQSTSWAFAAVARIPAKPATIRDFSTRVIVSTVIAVAPEILGLPTTAADRQLGARSPPTPRRGSGTPN